jgi:hypothetical protein
MKIKLTERVMKTQLIIAVGLVAAILIMGIGSHTAFAIKVSKTSFQDGYNAGFAAGKKDRKNGNEFDSRPPKGRSDAYDESYRRGYDDGWSKEDHFDSNSIAAASSSAAASDDHHGRHKHKDSAAASSSSSATDDAAASSSAAAAGGDGGDHKDSAAASSSAAAAGGGGGGSSAASSSAAAAGGGAAASSSSSASG